MRTTTSRGPGSARSISSTVNGSPTAWKIAARVFIVWSFPERWSRVQIESHTDAGPESRCHLPGDLEPDPLVEAQCVRIRDDVDMARSGGCSSGRHIANEKATDSKAHRIRLHEQIVELAAAIDDLSHTREAEVPPRGVHRNPDPSLCDRKVRRFDRIRMGGELGSILLP